MLDYIIWNVNPEIFPSSSLSIRWYGLLWGAAIYLAWIIVNKIFEHEKCPKQWSEKLFIYGAIGLIVGARLGHCLFYGANGDFFYYYKHPFEMLYVWEGGLASHGGALGLLVAMYLYNKYITKKGYLWILDRLVIGVALGGALIRLGNLMNSEIYGGPTTMPWGFIFVLNGEVLPKHPTQIYEMIYCLLTFGLCYWMYWKKEAYKKQGLIFGVFLLGIFLSRSLLEFIKNNQEAFEEGMLLNMGQLLSLPFVAWGLYLIYNAFKKKNGKIQNIENFR